MNKIYSFLAVAVVTAGLSSCGGSSKAPENFGDSLSVFSGEMAGNQILGQYLTLPEDQKALYDKDEMMRGFKQVVMADSSQQAYITGIQIALGAYNQLTSFEKAGIPVNRKAFYEAYAKAFLADSVNQPRMEELQKVFEALQGQANAKMQEYYMAEQQKAQKAKEDAPEAKANEAKGAKFIKDLKAKDASLVETPSGLVYKVNAAGEGPAVGEKGSAKVKYTGKLIDGTVFDANADGMEFRPGQVIPGFSEGLKMMKKGSKYTLYIPGKLAYGVDGTPDGKIGPNSTLIFEVEVLDVNPEAK